MTYATLLASGPYSYVTPVERLLPDFEATLVSRDFAADVTWEIRAPEEKVAALGAALVDMSHGEIDIMI